MLSYDEFQRLIRTQVKTVSPSVEDEQILIIYQSNALNVQKGVAFDGDKFYVVTYENGNAGIDVYERALV